MKATMRIAAMAAALSVAGGAALATTASASKLPADVVVCQKAMTDFPADTIGVNIAGDGLAIGRQVAKLMQRARKHLPSEFATLRDGLTAALSGSDPGITVDGAVEQALARIVDECSTLGLVSLTEEQQSAISIDIAS
jgi:hypothetical protein